MKIKPRKQPDGEACGPTSIQMAADSLGLPVSFKEIARISKYKKSGGMTNTGLVKTLEKLGFVAAEKIGATWNDLASGSDKGVAIVSWMLKGYIGHFSVVDHVTKTHIFLADPSEGKIIRMPKMVFMRLWFDYDDMWFPKKNTDIQLRWMVRVTKNEA